MRYTDLIFDLYGTLVDIHTEENDLVWEKTALYFGFYGVPCTARTLKADFQSALRAREAGAGQSYECYPDIPFESIMAELFENHRIPHARTLGINAAQLFRICSIEYLRLYPGVREALAKLRGLGCRLWLLSNAQRIFTAYELRQLGLGGEFDGIYISSDWGFRKPDSRFFRALTGEQKLNVNRCLMIGNDRDTDIAGAQAAGMATVYMHTELTPREQAPADPRRNTHRHWEFEGDDWEKLSGLIASIVQEEI